MSTETTVLDEGLYGNPKEPSTSNLASTGQRFGNYIIDAIFLYILNTAIVVGFLASTNPTVQNNLLINFLFFGLSSLYYLIAEGTGGKTIGKLITRTKVVNEEGEKPSFSSILIRTLSRIVPFEPLSAFSSSKRMWHDSWSKTYVIKSK